MAELNYISLSRLKNIILFGNYGSRELKNGYKVKSFIPVKKMHCADYRLSQRMIGNMNGTDLQNTKVVAVKHRPNFDYGTYVAQYKGKTYDITYIVPDESKIVTYDLISLKLVDKNG